MAYGASRGCVEQVCETLVGLCVKAASTGPHMNPTFNIARPVAASWPSSFCRRQTTTRRTLSQMASKWDNIPALFANEDAFWDRHYWDTRYQQERTTFEWYRSYTSLQPVLTKHLPKEGHLLQLGVGTSRLQVDMADDGYNKITSIDYSPVAIQRLQQLYPGYGGRLTYAVADARSMPQYPDAGFSGVLDKGTLDALLCGDTEAADAAALLGEVWRLLQPGAAYVMITSAAPESRLKYLQSTATPWQQLLVYEVGQQGALAGPYDCTTTSSSSSSSSSSGSSSSQDAADNSSSAAAGGSSGGVEGLTTAAAVESNSSSSAGELLEALQLPQMAYSHLVYVCCK
ncbi:S-adenosyl-L-methionine-dependent methyltransferase [Scenedesmus sp. NREL 46B-D3]|nr:S-adenosyl-L-methionine-dependent methyltransferase [Scenedesmus sp. NREL 46B-D3]